MNDQLPPRIGHILRLAEIIREVDGSHNLGASALAEAILSHPNSRGLLSTEPPAAGEVAELVQWLRRMAGAGLGGYDELNADRAADLLERLASPPSDGPSDEEVLKEAANALGYEYTPAWFETRGGALEAYPHELIDFARVITRYARPTPAPIPVSERLPGPEDCDAEGRCWWFAPGGGEFVPSWRLCQPPNLPQFTHWLPYWALPLNSWN